MPRFGLIPFQVIAPKLAPAVPRTRRHGILLRATRSPVRGVRIVKPAGTLPPAARLLRFGPPRVATSAITASATGLYRVWDDTLEGYEVYRGVDAAPDLSGAPYDTATSLPIVLAPQDPDHVYQFVTRHRNRFDLVSQNVIATTIEVDADGNEVNRPSSPTRIEIAPAEGGTMLVTARYAYAADGATANQANEWYVYITFNGVDPDVETDTPVEVDMVKTDGIAKLSYTTAAQVDGTVVKVIVRTSNAGVESSNVDIYSATAETTGPAAPSASTFLGTTAEQAQ